MSYAIKNWLEVFGRWREAFLRSHPERRLFPELPEDSSSSGGIITLGDKGKKVGLALVALVVLFALASDS